jgi:hypothetical protein
MDVSASGIVLNVRGSVTFPGGITVTAFADDTDPLDFPDIAAATAASNVNGDLVSWTAPVPITVTLAIIPGSEDDNNLGILYNANRASKGRKTARDVITITGTYPDGSTVTLTDGVITSGNPGKGVASSGRLKTRSYVFAFQDVSSTRATDVGGVV